MMTFRSCFFTIVLLLILFVGIARADDEEESSPLVKLCLFYGSPSGHARSDPILNQVCQSDHVHTFYGPTNFHPNTSYEQLRDTPPQYSTSPWIENQSLYWHPSIYEVTKTSSSKVYKRINELDSSPYYRWDMNSSPEQTVAFPPGFRMIAYSASFEDETEGVGNLLVECCDIRGEDDESCTNTFGNPLTFPSKKCDFLGIAFAMPTCWDETKGIGTEDPVNHMAYTVDGTVSGACPSGFNKRVPQVQLFIRIRNYRGDVKGYQLSDGSDTFHVDFMNGWKEGKLQEVMDKCEPSGVRGYNPPCDCDQFLTATGSGTVSQAVCDSDVQKFIMNEETMTKLPRGTCDGGELIPKNWDNVPPFTCFNEPFGDDGGESEDGSGSGDEEDGDGDGDGNESESMDESEDEDEGSIDEEESTGEDMISEESEFSEDFTESTMMSDESEDVSSEEEESEDSFDEESEDEDEDEESNDGGLRGKRQRQRNNNNGRARRKRRRRRRNEE